jgi:hypothetical protein
MTSNAVSVLLRTCLVSARFIQSRPTAITSRKAVLTHRYLHSMPKISPLFEGIFREPNQKSYIKQYITSRSSKHSSLMSVRSSQLDRSFISEFSFSCRFKSGAGYSRQLQPSKERLNSHCSWRFGFLPQPRKRTQRSKTSFLVSVIDPANPVRGAISIALPPQRQPNSVGVALPSSI